MCLVFLIKRATRFYEFKVSLVSVVLTVLLAVSLLSLQLKSFLMCFLFFQFFFLIPFLCCRYISSGAALVSILMFSGIFALINGIVFLVFLGQVLNGGLHKYDTLIGFSNPRFYGHVQLVFISVMFGYILDKKPRFLLSTTLLVIIAFTFFHAVILGSRSVIAGVLFATLISIYFSHERRRALYVCIYFWVLVFMFLSAVFLLFDLSVAQQLVDRGSSGRILLWNEAIKFSTNNTHAFLFGHGYSDFQHVVLGVGRDEKHPHNIFLDFSFRFGVIVGFGIAMLVFFVCLKLVRLRLRGRRMALAKVLPVSAVIVAANFTAIYVPAISQVMLAILLTYAFSGVHLPLLKKSSLIVNHKLVVNNFLFPFFFVMLLVSAMGVGVTLDALKKEDATASRIYPYLFAD